MGETPDPGPGTVPPAERAEATGGDAGHDVPAPLRAGRSGHNGEAVATATAPTLVAVGPGPEPPSSAEVVLLASDHLPISRSPEVLASDPWAEAGRKVLRHHIARMLAKVPGTIAGADPEEVHDMRVAARRVRAAWRVFGDAFERPVVREVGELRAIGGRLGAVRDLDVLIGSWSLRGTAGRSGNGRAWPRSSRHGRASGPRATRSSSRTSARHGSGSSSATTRDW